MKKIILSFIFLLLFFNLVFPESKKIDNSEYPSIFGQGSKDFYISFDLGSQKLVDFGENEVSEASLSTFYTFSDIESSGFLTENKCNLSLQNNKIQANWNFDNKKLKAFETFLLSNNANSNHQNLGKKILEKNFWMQSKVFYKVENEDEEIPINISVNLDGLEYKDILQKIFKKEKNAQKITLINITPVDPKCQNNVGHYSFNNLNFTKSNNFILTNNNTKIFFADSTEEKDKVVKENENYKLNNQILNLPQTTFKVKTKTNAEKGEKTYGISDTFFLFHKIKNLNNKTETEKFVNQTLNLTKNSEIEKVVKSIEKNYNL